MACSIFGPVPSRRLGRSLGVDVIPSKTCSYDCVYCESGRTTHLTVRRGVFVPPESVFEELTRFLIKHPSSVDTITFSSAGEPTLYEPLGDLIRAIKKHFEAWPVVVLTNGSLLHDPQVRRDLLSADQVVPSLDAVSPEAYKKLNRPHPSLDISEVVEGLKAFRKEYRGRFHLEILLASGFNDHAAELERLRGVIEELNPDEIELNTVVRPPAHPGVRGLTDREMKIASRYFPKEKIRIIGHFQASSFLEEPGNIVERVIELIRRRPCTFDEMVASLAVDATGLQKTLLDMERRELLFRYTFGGKEYICDASVVRK